MATGFTDARVVAGSDSSPYRAQRGRCLSDVIEQERDGPDPDRVARIVERLSWQRRPPARRPAGRWARALCAAEKVAPAPLRDAIVRRRYGL